MYNINYQALEQFKILNYVAGIPSYFISMLTIIMLVIILNSLLNMDNLILLNRGFAQIILEELYFFILNVIKQNIGQAGIKYFPVVFTIFLFIYIVNMGGLLGYTFQITSQIFVTCAISISLFIGVIEIGLENLKDKFWNQFLPKDAPKVLFPLLVVIETISYIIRPFTLAIRLFANIFSGHVLLFVIMSFVVAIFEKNILLTKIIAMVFPLFLFFFIMTLEILIMFLQAYVFIILFCVYLNDSLHAH